jgi:hypothetical protein
MHRQLDELMQLTLVFAHHAYHRLHIDLVRLVEQTLARLGDDVGPNPLYIRLLGVAANFGWQRGDLDAAEERARRSLALAASIDAERATAPAREALGAVMANRGDLLAARQELTIARQLAAATGDSYTEALALCDLGLAAAYMGHETDAAIHSEALDTLATRLGAPSIQAWACYLRGERRAQHDPANAIHDLAAAVSLADEVDDRFVAGAARHTLMTTTARIDERSALESLGVLLDQWHAAGAWTQLWMTIRALIETLSRHGRHRDAIVLLAARAASPRATPLWGSDADRLTTVASAARETLGDAFETAWAEGSNLGEAAAVGFARALTNAPAPS